MSDDNELQVVDPEVADPHLKEKMKVERPKMYAVIFHNDDYTTMEFVTEMLTKHFDHDMISATDIMLDVHHNGQGIAGVFTRDIAETKMAQVMMEAQQKEYPLRVSIQRED